MTDFPWINSVSDIYPKNLQEQEEGDVSWCVQVQSKYLSKLLMKARGRNW